MNPKIGFSIWLMFFTNIILLVVGLNSRGILPPIGFIWYFLLVIIFNIGTTMVILSYIMGEKHESRIRRI